MKKKKATLLSALCTGAIALSLTACGSNSNNNTTTTTAETITVSAETNTTSTVDVSDPFYVVVFGDANGIEMLTKAAQNFEQSF